MLLAADEVVPQITDQVKKITAFLSVAGLVVRKAADLDETSDLVIVPLMAFFNTMREIESDKVKSEAGPVEGVAYIDFNTFASVDLRIGIVESVEDHPNADPFDKDSMSVVRQDQRGGLREQERTVKLSALG